MSTEATQQILRQYFDAWTRRDTTMTSSLLSPDFRFEAGQMVIRGRDEFLDAGAFPTDASVELIAEAYQDGVGFQLYDASRGTATVRIVEQLTVSDGTILSSRFVTDMTAFSALVAQ